ncbi:hypothetical protein [Paraburkholderia acidisoli]|uniref:Uncharacterized protein n=1 Tax=Paraburkholderia acidisoli TaxID=2571748 RepID=A0A7Z2GQU4_9BURK|nr:hypothetical protein [Paraburkholderia acidisoli]QGZ66014.1 hypothetical protein FAZ98_29805 [Paraburkholderia acidisoli]
MKRAKSGELATRKALAVRNMAAGGQIAFEHHFGWRHDAPEAVEIIFSERSLDAWSVGGIEVG